jgi:hypothetical protein
MGSAPVVQWLARLTSGNKPLQHRAMVAKKIYRKLRVATKIGSTFFLFLTSYRAAEKVQNDYLLSA